MAIVRFEVVESVQEIEVFIELCYLYCKIILFDLDSKWLEKGIENNLVGLWIKLVTDSHNETANLYEKYKLFKSIVRNID